VRRVAWIFLLWCGLAPAVPVTFSDRLDAKFHHSRCLQCHQFNNPGRDGRAYNSHRSRYLCSQCHTAQVTGIGAGDWLAPDIKLDFTGLDAKATCQLIKRNLGDDKNRISHHLLSDARVRWALESGLTPGGQKQRVPGGYKEWEKEVGEWLRDGMRCE
jgi:hypothetical protein